MINEQRVQATLDFATRNAFETLNKFAQWASTPNAEIQFNLIDTVATLNGSSASNPNPRGIFLKPIRIPSLNSVTTGVFGPVGTDAIRNMYWNINFQSNGSGWIFENYSQGSNSSGPKAKNNAELKILVNTIFGSDTMSISIINKNVTTTSYNYSETINGSTSFIKIVDDQSSERILLNAISSKILSDYIYFGNETATSSLNGNFGSINIYNQTSNKNILSFSNNVGGDSLLIGRNDNASNTTISGGTLNIVGNSNQNSGFSVLSQIRLIDATYNKTYEVGIAIPLVDGLLSTVNIGSANPSSIVSSNIVGLSSVNIGAISSINAYTRNGAILRLGVDGELFVKGNQKIHGTLKNEISSGSAVYIGINNGDGNTSKEISVTKGQVLIPNLYSQKKANYVLSGIKHVSAFNTNPSIKFIPIKASNIQNDRSQYTCEYSSKIQHTPTIRTTNSEFDTTINDHSGVLKSYIAKYSSDTTIELMSAPVQTTGGNQDKTITSAYTLVTTTGLSALSLPKSSSNRLIKLWSTPNYMYVFILNSDSFIDVYYSNNSVDFSKLCSLFQVTYSGLGEIITSLDLDSVSNGTIDNLWFSVVVPIRDTKIDYNVTGDGFTPVTINLVNNCGVPVVKKYNITQSQYVFLNGEDTLVRTGEKCRISCVSEGIDSKVVAYTIEQYYGIHEEVKRKKSSLFSTLTGVVVGGVTGGVGGALTGELISNFGSNTTTRSTSERIRLVISKYEVNELLGVIEKTVLNSEDSAMLIRDAHVADIDISILSPSLVATQAIAYYSRNTDTYKVYFNLVTDQNLVVYEGMDYTQGLNYSGVSFAKNTTKIVKRVLTGNTDLWLNAGSGYSLVTSAQVYDNMKILDDNVFAYYNSTTKSIQYYSTDSTPGIPLTSIQTYNSINLENPYNIYGMFVDYISLTGDQFDGYNSFVLSNTSQGNGVAEYSLDSSSTVGISDRNVSVETVNGEPISVIDSSETNFTKRNIGIISKLTGPSNYILTVTSKNAQYDTNFKLLNTSGEVVRSLSLVSDSLNVHIEPISYIVKNIKNSVTTASVANYTISSTSVPSLYLFTFNNNPYSGYRVSYKAEDAEQTLDSNITGTNIAIHPLGYIGENLNMSYYVHVGNEYTTVIRSQATDNGDVSEITSRLFKTNHRLIKIHNSLIDPLNSLFDPTISLMNEFGNVVSVRMDSIGGFRSGPILRYNSQIVLGLTEIASTGEPCI